MAYRNRNTVISLKGFEEVMEKLQEAGKNIDVEARKCFEKAAQNIYDALYEQSVKAGLDNRLVEELDEEFIEAPSANIMSYRAGWKKQKPSSEKLPDFYKVVFYNYGTPSVRKTKKGNQRVQIDGKWVTLSTNRGRETAHPAGSHGFIKKAKLSAAKKNKKLFIDFLNEALGD